MLKKYFAIAMLFVFLFMVGCSTHIHQVGQGAQGSNKVELRQWYILWGLIPLNQVDSNAMADGAADYTIQTQQSAVDVIISIFTSVITVHPRTVTVTK